MAKATAKKRKVIVESTGEALLLPSITSSLFDKQG
jgi:hypothetical protein